MHDQPRITVLVGTCNRRDLLKRCLGAVRAEGLDFVSVKVIDAGSTDGTRKYLENQADIQAIFETERRGQAWALNRAAEQSQTDYLCWLSDDNIIRSGALLHAVQSLDRDPSIGLVCLKVRDATGPSAHLPFIGAVGSTGVLNCNQGIVRSSLFRELGGFDEQLRDYFIDNDLTTRVLLAGSDVVFTKKVTIDHFRQHEQDSWIGTAERKERISLNKRLYEAKFERLLLYSAWRAMQGSFLRRHLRAGRSSLKSFHVNFTAEVQPEEREWGCEVFSEFIDFSKREEDLKVGFCLRQHLPEDVRRLAMPYGRSENGTENDEEQMSFLNEVRQLRQTSQFRLEAFERLCAGFGGNQGDENEMLQVAKKVTALDRRVLSVTTWANRLFLGKTITEWLVLFVLVRSAFKSRETTIVISKNHMSKYVMYSTDVGVLCKKLVPKIKNRFLALRMNMNLTEDRL